MKEASIGGTLWFGGWLFTIGFAHLVWWRIILGNSALDRLANASYQIVIEGSSYRERLSPHRRKEARKGALTE